MDNGRDIAKQFEKFCSDKRTFSKAEEKLSWINIFLSPYPLGTIERFNVISSEGIEQLLKLSRTQIKIYLRNSVEFGTGNLPLNFGQPTFGSAILRQVEPSKAAFNSLTIEFFVNGRAKFFIPLRYLPIQKNGSELMKSSRVREALGELWGADREFSAWYLRFFDVGQLWLMVANLVGYYREWLGKGSGLTDVRVGISVENVWRSVAFCDMDGWGTHVQKFGLPIMNRDAATIPEDIGRGWLVSLDEKEIALWVSICDAIGLAFGLPTNLFSDFLISFAEQRPQESA